MTGRGACGAPPRAASPATADSSPGKTSSCPQHASSSPRWPVWPPRQRAGPRAARLRQPRRHRSRHQRGLRRRRQLRSHLQRRLRRALQPDGEPHRPQRSVPPLPLGGGRLGRQPLRPVRRRPRRRPLADPDECDRCQRRSAADARPRGAADVQHGHRRRTVFLLDGVTPVTSQGDMAGKAGVIDMVGLGAAPGTTAYETAPGPAATATTSPTATPPASTPTTTRPTSRWPRRHRPTAAAPRPPPSTPRSPRSKGPTSS